MNFRHTLLSTGSIALFALCILATDASASGSSKQPITTTSIVSGRLMFHQIGQNYCQEGTSVCGASRYSQLQYDSMQPLRKMQVELRTTDGNNVLLGVGSTDQNGNFSIRWTPRGTNTSENVAVIPTYAHNSGRFYFTGGVSHKRYWQGTVQKGSSVSVGTVSHGSTLSPTANRVLSNYYDALLRMWENVLSTSYMMQLNFHDVEISAATTSFTLNCALPGCSAEIVPNLASPTMVTYDKNIELGEAGWNNVQNPDIFLHEVARVAMTLASPGQARILYQGNAFTNVIYGYGGSKGWSLTSPEWSSAQFEEGFATFLVSAAKYPPGIHRYYACAVNQSPCPGTYSLEGSLGGASDCSASQIRQPIQVARFFWDLYDTTSFETEIATYSSGGLLDRLNGYGSSHGNLGKNEVWNGNNEGDANLLPDDLNGRSLYDYIKVSAALGSDEAEDAVDAAVLNCGFGHGD